MSAELPVCVYRLSELEKDNLINSLSSKIKLLESKQSDFQTLNNKFKQLQNDYTLLAEAKLRLEYEAKQKEEAFTKKISDLQNENEIIKSNLIEKANTNQKLFDNRSCLENKFGQKNCDIANLTTQINHLENQVNEVLIDNEGLQNTFNELTVFKNNQKDHIEQLVQDNQKLSSICQNLEMEINQGINEQRDLENLLHEEDIKLSSLNQDLKNAKNNLMILDNENNKGNEINKNLRSKIYNCKRLLDDCKNENSLLKNELMNETNQRKKADKDGEELKNILNQRELELKNLQNNFQHLSLVNDRTIKLRDIQQNINDNLRSEIMFLTDQNQLLIGEIENVLESDQILRGALERKERIMDVIRMNKNDGMSDIIEEERKIYESL